MELLLERLNKRIINWLDDELFLFFELMECSLRSKILQVYRSGLRFGSKDIKIIFRQIVAAIGYLHENQIMHRDLKTSNILIDQTKIKVADFGFSRHFGLPFGCFSHEISNPLIKF